MGGNPLQEGILADSGWQNRGVRDETYARTAADHNFRIYESLLNKAQPIADEHGVEAAEQWLNDAMNNPDFSHAPDEVFQAVQQTLHNQPMPNLKTFLDPTPEGGDVRVPSEDFSIADMKAQERKKDRGDISILEDSEEGDPHTQLENDDHKRKRDQDRAQWTQNLGDDFINRTPEQQTQDMHNTLDSLDERYPQDQTKETPPEEQLSIEEQREKANAMNKAIYTPKLEWEPGQPGRGILFGGNPRTGPSLHTWPYDPANPKSAPYHAEYMQSLGLNPNTGNALMQKEMAKNMAQIYIDPDGTINASNVTPEQIQHIQAHDPRIKAPAPVEDSGFSFGSVRPPALDMTPYDDIWTIGENMQIEAQRKEAFLPLLLAGGAALGGLIGGGSAAAEGGDFGDIAEGALGGAAMGAIPGGAGLAAKGVGTLMSKAPALLSKLPLGQMRNSLAMSQLLDGASTAGQGVLGIPPEGAMQQPAMPAQPVPVSTLAAFDHPDTDPNMHKDQHELKDGDHSNWGYDSAGSGGAGGSDALTMTLPKLIEYYFSDEAGENDPDIVNLRAHHDGAHEPDADPEHNELRNFLTQLSQLMIEEGQKEQGVVAAVPNPGAGPAMGTPNNGHVPQTPASPASAPGIGGGTCKCGQPLPPGLSECPGCTLQNQQQGVIANGNIQYVQQQPGTQPAPSDAAIPAAPVGPGNNAPTAKCSHCGFGLTGGGIVCPNCGNNIMSTPGPVQPTARVAHQGPHTAEQFSAVADLLTEQGRDAEITTMLAQPEQYGEEMTEVQQRITPPEDATNDTGPPPVMDAGGMMPPGMPPPGMPPGPPGAMPPGGPMAGPQGQMMAAVEKYATPDSIAPRCPKCNSGTTGIATSEGDIQCHACGNTWSEDLLEDAKTGGFYFSDVHGHEEVHGLGNDDGVPAADQEHQRDVSLEQDSSLTWTDGTGEPLQVGKEYEMKSANYDIPDIVRIEAVKPDAIQYTITGEYGLEHATEIHRDEAEIEQLEFIPTDASTEDQPTADNPEPEHTMDSPEMAGVGDQTDLSSPTVRASVDPDRAWLLNGLGESSPDTVPAEWSKQATTEPCEVCGTEVWDFQPCPRCGHVLGEKTARTAGAKFTPMEQRDFIDEQGTARNSDKLNLSGTHYTDTDDDADDEALFW